MAKRAKYVATKKKTVLCIPRSFIAKHAPLAIGFFVGMCIFSGISLADIPTWIQPGLTVVYDGVSSGISNGQPVNGVATVVTIRVTRVQGNTIQGTTNIVNPQISPSIWQLNSDWTCTDGQKCASQFWVDPLNPSGSISGPNGEPYTQGGVVPYSSPFGGPALDGVKLLYYTNPDSGAEFRVAYQSRTGLIASYTEKYPSEQVYLYFKSISIDLSDYSPPQGQQNQNDPDGTGIGGEGPGGSDAGNNPAGNGGTTIPGCPTGFLLFAPCLTLALALPHLGKN